MAKATLNKNGIATKAGELTVYNYAPDTREYLSATVEYLPVGVGIPADSCITPPGDAETGFAILRTVALDGWESVPDHRGETVYDTETGQAVDITTPGEYADNVTTLKPATPYDKWNGSAWVTDENAQKQGLIKAAEQKQAALLDEAQGIISLWQTELQLGSISDADRASLIAWMSYIKKVQGIKPEDAPDIEWLEKPE